MKTIVVAPHPDDEVLGSAGTILRRKAEGAEVAWLIVTGMKSGSGWTEAQIEKRSIEIEKIKTFFLWLDFILYGNHQLGIIYPRSP